ncbi:hypothetical protein [Salana multivorans]
MVTDLEHASACESVRHLVSWVLASTQEPYLPWLATASLGQLHDAIALTAAQLEHDRAALTRLASPECAAALPTPDALDRVLRALGLPLTVEDLEPTLPHIALSRRAALAAFTADPTLHAAALGWLTASQALLGARRFPTAEAIRAHGFGADTAASWEAQFEPATSMPCLQVTELILRERPSLAPMTLAGAAGRRLGGRDRAAADAGLAGRSSSPHLAGTGHLGDPRDRRRRNRGRPRARQHLTAPHVTTTDQPTPRSHPTRRTP